MLRALEFSSAVADRRVAGFVVGYIRRSEEQIRVLVRVSRDPDNVVRDHAIRALWVLAKANPRTASGILPGAFIEMLNSGRWDGSE